MDLIHKPKERLLLSPTVEPSYLFIESPPPPLQTQTQTSGFNLNNNVSPSILLIIIILAIIFFISGLLHLLVRFLLRPQNRVPDEIDNDVTALQGQLQQLFHLHDAGVDQSFIDTLPVFNYKEIIGVKDPFDCAVCLCEFDIEDKLRLLPKCSHAFHMDCIDTWLLSHSTCPLCRANLVPDFSGNGNFSPIVLVLESGSESARENVLDNGLGRTNSNSVVRVNSHLSASCGDSFRVPSADSVLKSGEIVVKEDENRGKVVSVKLGKFRNVDGGNEGSSDSNADARRCFSMGSFAYVMDENSALQVPIRTPMKKQSSKKPYLPLKPGHRQAMSECGCDSRRDYEGFKILDIQTGCNAGSFGSKMNGKSICSSSKRESFSISKIWLRGKKDESDGAKVDSSRRAFSFRFPLNRNAGVSEELKPEIGGRRAISEIDIDKWENGESGRGFGNEAHICNNLDSQAQAPSFARRTLLWLMGKPNKVVHSSSQSNV